MGRLKDLTGKKFGRLLVINRVGSDKSGHALWNCQCDCDGKIVVVAGTHLLTGDTQSCGCYHKQKASKTHKKYNKYDLESEEYGIGFTFKGEEFWFDKEDYELIKDYCWRFDSYGYVVTNVGKKQIFFHRVVTNCPDEMIPDHIERNNRFDNRKQNLRITDKAHNNMNKSMICTNTSGVMGVSKYSYKDGWCASVSQNNKSIYLGVFDSFEEAVKARLKAEKEYYGEFAPQQHLYEQYGIT